MKRLALPLAPLLGLALHLLLLSRLDLHDLPGPGGVLVARDLLLGEAMQGPASWLGAPLVALGLEVAPALRVLGALSLAAALLGVTLAAEALAGWRAGVQAGLLGACWTLVWQQALLVDPGLPAWGLAWLGVGLVWWGWSGRRPLPLAGGGLLLALGVATKASALPVLVLVVVAPWLRRVEGGEAAGGARVRLGILGLALFVGLGLGAWLGWLLQPPGQPWLAAQALGAEESGWLGVLALAGRGLPMGSFPWLLGLATLGAVLLARRQPAAVAVLLLSSLALVVIGEARGGRLQPRHLLPVSVGLVALVGALATARPIPRARWLAPALLAGLCALSALDGLAFVQAFAAQRARYAGTEPARLPALPGFLAARYGELPWPVFHESSLAGVDDLLRLPTASGVPVACPPFQERRDVHLELVSLARGSAYRRLSEPLCCVPGETLEACAVEVVDALEEAGALLVLPGKIEVISPEARPFARALMEALDARHRPFKPQRWRAVQGRGSGGPLPCREGR